MTHNFLGDDELDSLLRGEGDRLSAPPELWDSIRGRAKRRKLIKGSLAAAGVVVVLAGAVPAVIAVRDNSAGTGSVNPAGTKPPSNLGGPTSVPRPTDLSALAPETVSFDTAMEGYVSGPLSVDGGQISGGLGETIDGGKTWTPIASNPAPTGLVRMSGKGVGFSFGTSYQETQDNGRSWQTLKSPGYIEDLETNPSGRLWALVRSCVSCTDPRLFTATAQEPELQPALGIPVIDSYDAAITLAGNAIYVNGGQMLLRSLDGGLTWDTLHNPCVEGDQAFAAWSAKGLAAECTPTRGVGSLFQSYDYGTRWTDVGNLPSGVRAGVATAAAGTRNDLTITTGVGAPYVSTDAGTHWAKASIPGGGPVTFAAFIDNFHIVGLRGGAKPAFVTSDDGGTTWASYPFAN